MLDNETNTGEQTEDVHTILEQETDNKPASEQKTRLWSFGEDAEIISESKPGETSTNTSTNTVNKQPVKLASKEDAKMSAETVVTSIGIVLDMGGSMIISQKCKKKFTPEEFKRAKEIRDINPETLIPSEVMLQNKFKRELAVKDSKIKELEIEKPEYDKLTAIWAKYFEVTGKSVSPEFMLYMGMANLLIDKASVIFMD